MAIEINRDQINNYLARYGNEGKRVIERLAVLAKTKVALDSPMGKEIMDGVSMRLEELLDKIIDEKSTEAERAEFRALKNIAKTWMSKIVAYESHIKQIQEGGSDNG